MGMIKKLVLLFVAVATLLEGGESTTGRRLRVAIPDALFPPFVAVEKNSITGFSIDVFTEAWKLANISSPYDFVSVNGTYNAVVERVGRKDFDAAVGDFQILGQRLLTVDFTVPYLASGITIIVPQKHAKFKTTWILDVFTKEMWIIILAMHLSISLVAALMELSTFELKKLFRLWLTLLFFTEREPLESDVGRYIRAVWMLVIAVLVASYYAILTSTLTVSRLKPSVPDIERASVGCNKNSFLCNDNYLRDVLGTAPQYVEPINNMSHYIDAFNKSEIQAAYLIEPHARVFLKMYGNKFIEWGTPQHLGGLAFVFPKGSPLTSSMSVAISGMMESGAMAKLEKKMIDSIRGEDSSEDEVFRRINPADFAVLLILSATGLTLGFVVVAGRMISKWVAAKKALLMRMKFRENEVVELSPSFKGLLSTRRRFTESRASLSLLLYVVV